MFGGGLRRKVMHWEAGQRCPWSCLRRLYVQFVWCVGQVAGVGHTGDATDRATWFVCILSCVAKLQSKNHGIKDMFTVSEKQKCSNPYVEIQLGTPANLQMNYCLYYTQVLSSSSSFYGLHYKHATDSESSNNRRACVCFYISLCLCQLSLFTKACCQRLVARCVFSLSVDPNHKNVQVTVS